MQYDAYSSNPYASLLAQRFLSCSSKDQPPFLNLAPFSDEKMHTDLKNTTSLVESKQCTLNTKKSIYDDNESKRKRLEIQYLKGRDDINLRNFFNGGVQDIQVTQLWGAKVPFSSAIEALNEGAKSIEQAFGNCYKLPSTGHEFDPLMRVIMNMVGKELKPLLLALGNVQLIQNPHYSVKDETAFSLNKRNTIPNGPEREQDDNRRARLIHFLIPNPPEWVKEENGTYFIKHQSDAVAGSIEDRFEGKDSHLLKRAKSIINSPRASPKKRKRGMDPSPLRNFYSPSPGQQLSVDDDDFANYLKDVPFTPEKEE